MRIPVRFINGEFYGCALIAYCVNLSNCFILVDKVTVFDSINGAFKFTRAIFRIFTFSINLYSTEYLSVNKVLLN